jgi:hypothetical protein
MATLAVTPSEFSVRTNPSQPFDDPFMHLVNKVANTIRGVLFIDPSYNSLNTQVYRVNGEETKEQVSLQEEIAKKTGELSSCPAEKKSELLRDISQLEWLLEQRRKYRIYVPIQIVSQASLHICATKHQGKKPCENSWPGTWNDAPPAGAENLPTQLPIESFIRQTGEFMEHGDMIKFPFEGHDFELTVSHRAGTKFLGDSPVSFSDHLKQLIMCTSRCQDEYLGGDVELIREEIRTGHTRQYTLKYVWSKTLV